jgi:hypothetical protein
MDINHVFGQKEEKVEEETWKRPSISPFDFINSINYTKEDLIIDDWSEKQYNPYVINKGLSFGSDTVIPANEMNSRPHLDKKLQYHFFINIIRPRKRYNKWLKASKIDAIDVVKTYYGYSTEKARQAIAILNPEQIDKLKIKIIKGGT